MQSADEGARTHRTGGTEGSEGSEGSEATGATGGAGGTETAGQERVEDNSVGRLLTLSDGVFAIAMTLLALDLKVPDLGSSPGDAALRHALWDNRNSYFAFVLSFYVIAQYWGRHRRIMRSVVTVNSQLVRDTMLQLFVVAVMPFPASLLGNYGGEPIALTIYGAVSALNVVTSLLLSYDVRRFHLAPPAAGDRLDRTHRRASFRNLLVFLLLIPSGYVLHHNAPWVLILLAVPTRRPVWWPGRLRPVTG